jgi:hypothetical protein
MLPSGAFTYTFSGGSSIVNPTVTTTYSVSGTSSLGCISLTPAITTITVMPLPTLSVNNGVICSGQSFTIIPTGALNYTYSGGSAVVAPSVNSTYSVSGNNGFGCINTAISNVSVNPLPFVSVLTSDSLICIGQTRGIRAATIITW